MSFEEWITRIGQGVDYAGALLIVAGALLAGLFFIRARLQDVPFDEAYLRLGHSLGRAILLGLELLVAADIIRTVAVEPTFRSVGVLAIIVAIRTFISMTLELEINGRFPWQPRERGAGPGDRLR